MLEIGELLQYFVVLILLQEIFPSRWRRIDLKAQTAFLSFVIMVQLAVLFTYIYFHGIGSSIIMIVITLVLVAKIAFNLRYICMA